MQAELKCSDGTRIRISAETERELRAAFGPPQETFKVGDILWRDATSGGCHYLKLVEEKGKVGLQSLLARGKESTITGFRSVENIFRITMDEVRKMTIYPGGLRKVDRSKLVISERD